MCFKMRCTMLVKRPRTSDDLGCDWQWRLNAVHISSDGCSFSSSGDSVASRSSSTHCGNRLFF